MSTRIEWCRNPDGTAGESWNPIRGTKGKWHCTKASLGCTHCYAERLNVRFGGPPFEAGADTLRLDESILYQPLHWRKARTVFVQSMGDLFHEEVRQSWLDRIFQVIDACQQHTFVILTKRAQRMADMVPRIKGLVEGLTGASRLPSAPAYSAPNAWLGVTAEMQATADARIPLLLQTPAAVRWVSVEPMLEPIKLRLARPCDRQCSEYQYAECPGNDGLCVHENALDWVVCGTESLAGRPGHDPELVAIEDLVQQCRDAGVPCFVKQAAIDGKLVKMPEILGRVWDQMPPRPDSP